MDLGEFYTLRNSLRSLEASSYLQIETAGKEMGVEIEGRYSHRYSHHRICYHPVTKDQGRDKPLILIENGK